MGKEMRVLFAGNSPAKLGTYLSACVFHKALTSEELEGLPFRIVTADRDGESVMLMRINEADAGFCQRVASETLESFTDPFPQ